MLLGFSAISVGSSFDGNKVGFTFEIKEMKYLIENIE